MQKYRADTSETQPDGAIVCESNMTQIALTRELAFASGIDAANNAMRKAGRSQWNDDDRDVATETTNRLLLYVPFEAGGLAGLDLAPHDRECLLIPDDVWERAQRDSRIGHNSAAP